ncbi:adenylate/guanylate cyclase domain-containing protein [Candidatus Ichthyocystis sparus]|uniref:adenylate/guanylate cyclase domain-containing protein n=2 Tax=Burkholderiales genera incertae sedis TaxID=224471 RepID=UPI000B0ABDA4|nr:adenylate/guanylate cyclase domain-containing protein [Candidatus Ichthyocystis sparus]
MCVIPEKTMISLLLGSRRKPPSVLLHIISSLTIAVQVASLNCIGFEKIPLLTRNLSGLLLAISIINTIVSLILLCTKRAPKLPNQEISLFMLCAGSILPGLNHHIPFTHYLLIAPWPLVFIVYVCLFHKFRYKMTLMWTYTLSLMGFMTYRFCGTRFIVYTTAQIALLDGYYQKNLILLSAVILVVHATYAKYQNTKMRVAASLIAAETEERLKTEEILLNTLPLRVICRLKKGERIIADRFGKATILFADLVGFTQMAHKVTPSQLFRMINKIFLEFDKITNEKHLEKIKTNGDSYMVAGGISPDSPDNPSLAAVELALKMKTIINELSAHNKDKLQLRIGISTGPVVAGVLGSRKFMFDVWGDTVNIASRLSNEGSPQSILVDEMTYKLCQNPELFDEPKEILLKGKGKCLSYPTKAKANLWKTANTENIDEG